MTEKNSRETELLKINDCFAISRALIISFNISLQITQLFQIVFLTFEYLFLKRKKPKLSKNSYLHRKQKQRNLCTNHSCDLFFAWFTLNINNIPGKKTMTIVHEFHFCDNFISSMTTNMFTSFITKTFSTLF